MKKTQKIIISATNDLYGDNRIYKTALSLIERNYEVLCAGRKLKHSKELNFPYETHRFSLIFKRGAFFYLEYNLRLFLFLMIKKYSILLSTDLDTLPANYFAARLRRKKLVYDSHEYFTEVPELENRHFVKSIWLYIEKRILPKIKFSYTVCSSIADIYNKKYNIDMQLVRNVPICNENNDNRNNVEKLAGSEEKIILYQGAINIGRGLEQLILAMKYVHNARLIIIGEGDIKKELEILTENEKLGDKVKFLGKKPVYLLPQYTKQAYLGISIEENIGLNYYYALPNKIFDYIKCGVPVLASKLPEIYNIVSSYNVGTFIESHDSEHIAEKIENMLRKPEQYLVYKQNCVEAAKELCWEKDFKNLDNIFPNL